MKKTILSNILLCLILIAFVSCDRDYSHITKNDPSDNMSNTNSNATAAYFPEPSLNWGSSPEVIISEMRSKGYTYNGKETENADMDEYLFVYKSIKMICSVNSKSNDYYCAYSRDITQSEAFDIVNKYHQVYNQYEERNLSYGSAYVMKTNDSKTQIYVVIYSGGGAAIEYSRIRQ